MGLLLVSPLKIFVVGVFLPLIPEESLLSSCVSWREAERGAKIRPDFTDEETEAQRGGRSSPPSQVGAEPGVLFPLQIFGGFFLFVCLFVLSFCLF